MVGKRDLECTVVGKRDLLSEEDKKTAENLLWSKLSSSKLRQNLGDSAGKGIRKNPEGDTWAVLRKEAEPLLVEYTSLSAEEMVRAGWLENQDVCIVDPSVSETALRAIHLTSHRAVPMLP